MPNDCIKKISVFTSLQAYIISLKMFKNVDKFSSISVDENQMLQMYKENKSIKTTE